tara:strand:- start:952 stop:1482 length:531 start_codon:yes stop_codon:yes gene_type:complete
MATFDLTAKSTTGVGANVVAGIPTQSGTHVVRTIQEYLDIDALIAAGNTIANGDIFQMLEIPAGTLVLNAGAEVMKAFTSSCTLDMDFGEGDDIIDGADITSTGFCAAGSNGQTNVVGTGSASTYTQFIGTADTIDCTIAGAAAATGRLRVYATVIDCNDHGAVDRATEVDRDLLA